MTRWQFRRFLLAGLVACLHRSGSTGTCPANPGLRARPGPPLGWFDPNYDEIGDICVGVTGTDGTIVGTDGVVYVVQKDRSNALNRCIVTKPAGADRCSACGRRSVAPRTRPSPRTQCETG
jgi:hypothetical protein